MSIDKQIKEWLALHNRMLADPNDYMERNAWDILERMTKMKDYLSVALIWLAILF